MADLPDAQATTSRWRSLGPWLLLLIVLLGGLALQRALSPEAVSVEPPDARPLVVAFAYERAAGPLPLARLGRIHAVHETRLATEISGRVVHLHPQLRPGGRVEAGTELLRLDVRPLQIRRLELQAEQRARAAEQTQLAVRLQRMQDLARRDFVAGDQLDELEARLAAATAAVERIDAQLQAVELDLERSRVYAPYAAHILEVGVAPGDIAQPGALLARLVTAEEQEVRVELTAAEWPLVEQAWNRQGLDAHIDTVTGERILLRSPRLGGSIDPGSRTVLLAFSLAQHGLLRRGEMVTVSIGVDPGKPYYRLPRESLQRQPGRVWRIADGGVLEAASVRVLLASDGDVFVASDDLGESGEVLITDLPTITQGMAVVVRERRTQ
ncbi:MAG: efflux RND transporter periplasmic adaptor subunit [Gammaproteobacteria bacterium]|nr:efflux RND transporter periplasmic adaptor subunit [Gammaproteobacteria bacterium]